MARLSTLKGHGKAEDMIAYYALWIGSIKLSELSGWHDLIISLCFHMETMLNQSVYICRPLTAKPPRKPKESLQSPKWGEVRTTVEYFFGEIKTQLFWFYVTTEDWFEFCWKDLFNIWNSRKCQGLPFATVQRWKSLEHWINIQVSGSAVKWYNK